MSTITLRSCHGLYLCAEADLSVSATRSAVNVWEQWDVEPHANNMIALKSVHGRYLCAEQGGLVTANRLAVGPWELFEPRLLGDGTGCLVTWQGTFLTADDVGRVLADRQTLGPWETWTSALFAAPVVPALPRLRTDGILFRSEGDGSIWRYRGFSAFQWYRLWLAGGAEVLAPYAEQAWDVGANIVRVFGCFTLTNPDRSRWLDPRVFGERYWTELPKFLRFLAGYGLRVEWTALCDQQASTNRLGVPVAEARAWVSRLAPILAEGRALLEVANEPPFNGVDPAQFMDVGRVPGLLVASGNYDYGYGPTDQALPNVRDYITTHNPRGPEWPRQAKDAARELGVEGYNQANPHPPFRVPVVGDEPMGADETNQPGRRSNVPEDFRDYARVAALFSAGATFHSQAGLDGTLLGPVQERCARAFFGGLSDVPLSAPTWQYSASHLSGCPLAADTSLRSYAMSSGDTAVGVCVRKPYAGLPRSANGWHIVSSSSDGGVVMLDRT